jgi:peroxiredoxin
MDRPTLANRLRRTLDYYAERAVPADRDLWPAIRQAVRPAVTPPGRALAIRAVLTGGLLLAVVLAVMLLTPPSAPSRGYANGVTVAMPTVSLTAVPSVEAATPLTPTLQIGDRAPDFSLPSTDGRSISLSSYRGLQPVRLIFVASWCPPCVQQLAAIETATGDGKDTAQVLVIDVHESAEAVQQFVVANRYPLPFLLDTEGNTSARYAIKGLPAQVLINRDGVIQDIQVGLNGQR